jgi:hypothetical protein
MQWLSRLMGTEPEPAYQFGHTFNGEVNPKEFELFTAASKAFEEGKILDAYKFFLNSLQNYTAGKPNHNITLDIQESTLEFRLVQGSAVVIGKVSDKKIEAYADIVLNAGLHVAIKRRLLERNYNFTYSSFYFHDDKVRIKIDLDNTTMTPQKIFFPIREIALNADFEKEFIASEFPKSTLLNTDALIPIDDDIKKKKYDFMRQWISECEASIKRLPSNDNTGMISFTYLELLLKIDYLIVPHKQIAQKITERLTEYYGDDSTLVENKNAHLQTYIHTLNDMPYEDFASQLYDTLITFDPMEKASDEEVVSFVEESLSKVRWYKRNRYPHVIPTIYNYMVFYLLYNYGLRPCIRRLLHLFVEINHSDYFKTLGYTPLCGTKKEQLETRKIKNRIDEVIKPQMSKYKQLKPFGEKLTYSSLNEFNHGFLLQIKHLDFTEL